MDVHLKRLFVGNLPVNVQLSQIIEKFESYGTVSSVEIKNQNKGLNENNTAFAFVNINIDDKSLEKCKYTGFISSNL